jgi:hypothetical protein
MATPTTTTTKPSRAKAGSARKPARAKAAGTRASTRKSATATAGRRGTQSRATRAKAARTRARHEGEQAVRDTGRAARQAQVATRDTAQVVGDYAERAVLIPVGAALIARDRIASTVGETISSYSTPSRAQQQLRKFERRGLTARKRLEREVRKARVRVERELRQRRRSIEHAVTDLEGRRDTIAKNGTDLAERVQERLLSLV